MWRAMWVIQDADRTDPVVYVEACRRWTEYGKSQMKSDVDMMTDGNTIWFTKQDDIALAFIIGFMQAGVSFNFSRKV
jgi:hypothetical protein